MTKGEIDKKSLATRSEKQFAIIEFLVIKKKKIFLHTLKA